MAEAGEGVVRDVQKRGFLQNGRLAFGEGREGGQIRGREGEACAKGDARYFAVGCEEGGGREFGDQKIGGEIGKEALPCAEEEFENARIGEACIGQDVAEALMVAEAG